jgi:hypothetical protein
MDPTSRIGGTRHEPVTTAFNPPGPTAPVLDVDAGAGFVRAGDRTGPQTRTAPRDPAEAPDVRAAEPAGITFADGRPCARATGSWRSDPPAGSKAGPVRRRTFGGGLFPGRVTGSAEIMTGRGRVRVTEILARAGSRNVLVRNAGPIPAR